MTAAALISLFFLLHEQRKEKVFFFCSYLEGSSFDDSWSNVGIGTSAGRKKKKKKSIVMDLIGSVSQITFSSKIVAFVISPAVFFALFFITAPFGKHEVGSSWLWGFRMNPKLAWMLMECPNFLSVFFFFQGPNSGSVVNAFLLALFLVHYINRAILYPLRARLDKSMPVSVFLFSFSWTLYNGIVVGKYLGHFATYGNDWATNKCFVVGVVLFFLGMGINVNSDEVLRNLRRPGDSNYYIPQESWFQWITSPNYFGEFIEWTGFAMATWSWPGVAFASFTFCNLFPRAVATHKWYLNRFGKKYPSDRRIFFPYLL